MAIIITHCNNNKTHYVIHFVVSFGSLPCMHCPLLCGIPPTNHFNHRRSNSNNSNSGSSSSKAIKLATKKAVRAYIIQILWCEHLKANALTAATIRSWVSQPGICAQVWYSEPVKRMLLGCISLYYLVEFQSELSQAQLNCLQLLQAIRCWRHYCVLPTCREVFLFYLKSHHRL